MSVDLAQVPHPAPEVARIAAHLPCLEAAAADSSAPALVRRALWAEIAVARVALALLGADVPDAAGPVRTTPDDFGSARTTPDDLGEAGRDC